VCATIRVEKILGLTVDATPLSVSSAQVNVNQVNVVGAGNALEAARRLAFSLEKAARIRPVIEPASTDRDVVPMAGYEASS
jgi:hypothetical protein